MPQHRNDRADRIGWILQHQTAVLITAWLEHQHELMADQQGVYPSGGSSDIGKVSGAGATVHVDEDEHGPAERIPVTSVEAVVMSGELMRDRREQVRDRLDGIVLAVNSLNAMLRRDLRDKAKALPELCDGRAKGYEGHMLAWVRYSRDDQQSPGWHDPGCRDIAGTTGLCEACLVRMNRWRRARGMEPVGVKAAASKAA